jgi:hypothetical protein
MKLKIFLVLVLLTSFCYAETGEFELHKKEMKKEGIRKEGMKREGMLEPHPQTPANIDSDTIEALKVARIKKELDLTPEQAGKFFENYYRVSDIKREYMEKKLSLINDIDGLLSKEKVDEKVLKEKVEAYYRLEKEMQEKMREVQDRVVDGLSLKQRAKLIVFEKNFERYVRNTLQRMFEKRKKEFKPEENMKTEPRPEEPLPPPPQR